MAQLNIEELTQILRECAGEPEPVADGGFQDRTFEEMGYDSLARLALAARIKRDLRVVIPEEEIDLLETPQDVLDYVNPRLATSDER